MGQDLHIQNTGKARPARESFHRLAPLYFVEHARQLPEETDIYHFPIGIPAFEDHTGFCLSQDPALAPLLFLVSTADPGLRFICLPAAALAPDFTYTLDAAEAAVLGVEPGQYPAAGTGLVCLAIITIRPGSPATANMLAPVVLSPACSTGLQSVQTETRWSHVHQIEAEEAQQCS